MRPFAKWSALQRLLVGLSGLLILASSASAQAAPKRSGLQMATMLGVSACIPGEAKCHYPADANGVHAHGFTRSSFAAAQEIGFRIPNLFVGGAYHFGLFNPRWDIINDERDYRVAYQHSLLLVLRPILPIWRFDLGFDLSPGWSRQVFRREASRDRDYTQGFAFKTGLLAAFYITHRLQIGARADFLFNFHGENCIRMDDKTTCRQPIDDQVLPVHQMMFGLHLSRVFF